MKTNQQVAAEVLMGQWGNGAERRKKLSEAGFNPDAVQSIVNAIVAGTAFPETSTAKTELNIQGKETFEVEIDLNKYNSINLTFVIGGA
jgi:hypothetical protein